eukprot:gnl/TRDRNA2_/TRDRNA2_192399_c0_seq1.p1 gnl/TRDRNA2_/TRDRNA2_192399_c0~~gnl/TRDRNA2_/TRDRNA2_192399_c0_seq1.p1  ORF type:complete len:341 (-),score=63.37 gnl/TRDRNA2_/TRDRNA2_192399_c0_seq1:103-1125(-)
MKGRGIGDVARSGVNYVGGLGAASPAAGAYYGGIASKAGGPPYATMPPQPSATAKIELSDGAKMPVFGLGVYMSSPGPETYNAVKWALELGYRLIDTATLYDNEADVGRAIRDSGIPRSELWITTKLWNSSHGYQETLRAAKKSMSLMGLDYIDLYLVHSPRGGKIVETWDAMLRLQREGLVRSIGVSNYGVSHLEALRTQGRPAPALNQIEMHPLVYQERRGLLDYCKTNGIHVQAYGSMFFGKSPKVAEAAVSGVVAAHLGKSAAQVLLRWGLQMGFLIIPKSVKRHRLEENMNIFDFELSDAEMAKLGALRGQLGAYWNPTVDPVDLGRTDFGHREL